MFVYANQYELCTNFLFLIFLFYYIYCIFIRINLFYFIFMLRYNFLLWKIFKFCIFRYSKIR